MTTKINTNFDGLDMKDVKNTILEQTPSKIDAIFEYPNGFIMRTIMTPEEVNVECNWELKKENDGSYTPIPPQD